MTAFALAVPLEAERALVDDAPRYGHEVVLCCSGAEELAARLPAARPGAALVTASPQYLSRSLVDACDAAGVRLLVTAVDPAEHRHARALGILDPHPGPPAWTTLYAAAAAPPDPDPGPAASDGRAPGGRPDAAPARRGVVVTVWGPHGAPGRTSIAIAIAAEAADAGLHVALADADTHAASIDPALGLLDEAPGFAAACRLAGAGSLDVAELDRVAEWVRSGHSGFRVLTGIPRAARWPELGADRVRGVIEAARAWVDLLVVDTAAAIEADELLMSDVSAPQRNAAALTALRAADHVIAIAAADPVGLARYLRGHAELLESASPRRVTTVVNKVRSSVVGLNPSGQVAQTLARFGGISDPVLVPWDPASFDAALLGARPLRDAAPRAPARLAIRDLVRERLLPPETGPARRRRRANVRSAAASLDG